MTEKLRDQTTSSIAEVLPGLRETSAWQEHVYKEIHTHPELSFQETKGAAFGVAISAALFTSLSGLNGDFGRLSDLVLGRTDNISIRFAAAVALLFNVMMVVVAIIAIAMTVPRDPRSQAARVAT